MDEELMEGVGDGGGWVGKTAGDGGALDGESDGKCCRFVLTSESIAGGISEEAESINEEVVEVTASSAGSMVGGIGGGGVWDGETGWWFVLAFESVTDGIHEEAELVNEEVVEVTASAVGSMVGGGGGGVWDGETWWWLDVGVLNVRDCNMEDRPSDGITAWHCKSVENPIPQAVSSPSTSAGDNLK